MNGTEETKKRLSQSHPYLYTFVVVSLSMLVAVTVSYLVQALGRIAVSASRGSLTREGLLNIGETPSSVLSILGYLVVLLVYFIIYRKELSFSFFSTEGTMKGIFMLWSELLIDAVTLFFTLMDYEELGSPGTALLMGITPGITEEILCRLIPISLVMRSRDREKLMLPAVVFTSVIFGSCHLINIFSGADPVTTLFQFLYATGTGFLFGAVYIRTGNPWITVILHSLTDCIFFLRTEFQVSGGVLAESTNATAGIFFLVYAVLYFVNAYFVFRNDKDGRSLERWASIWGNADSFR